jgi:hypothetical protein
MIMQVSCNPFLYDHTMQRTDWLDASFIIDTDSCVPWPYAVNSSGYPQIVIGGRQVGAHTVACAHLNGPRPDGMQAAHSCHNQWCVNPRHLRWATPAENGADRRSRDETATPPTRFHCASVGRSSDERTLPANGRLNAAQIADLCAVYFAGGVTQQQLADEYGISQATVSRYLHGYTYSR